jgi:transposase-like protein
MKTSRRPHSAQFKAKVALEAIKELKTTNELGALYEVHPTQISKWKKKLLAEASGVFSDGRTRRQADGEELNARLYQQIGQLKVELDWLKKKSGFED